MDLAAVMDAIGDRLDMIDGLRVHKYPVGSVSPPAAVLSYPDDYEYDSTYARGMDRMTLPVVLVVGKASERTARDRLAAYVNGSGTSSVKAVLESGAYTAFDVVVVKSAEFDVVRIADVDYLAAVFDLDIAGRGA